MHESYANVVFPLWSREVREEENIFLKKERVKKIGMKRRKNSKKERKLCAYIKLSKEL